VSEALRISRHPLGSVSLFWPVFLTNAILVVAGAAVLAFSPATISFPITRGEAGMLLVGVVALVAANAIVIHFAVRPLRRLVALVRQVDLLQPGQRLVPDGPSEVRALAAAINNMLVRFEYERRDTRSRALGTQEEQRRLVARELHDEVGQGLTALLLRLQEAVDAAPPDLQPQLRDAQALARERLEAIRRLARDLRPAVLDQLGIAYALHMLADFVEAEAGFRCRRDIDVDLPRPAPDTELALYRIAQEALTNVVRHADASSVVIEFHQSEEGPLVLVVEDDGRGLPAGAQLGDGGLQGMRDRAFAIDATLRVEPASGSTGTRVSVRTAAPS
jgi:two-component system sensor histidine kinase UhpB